MQIDGPPEGRTIERAAIMACTKLDVGMPDLSFKTCFHGHCLQLKIVAGGDPRR
jgi:hypothetical protein